MSWQHLLPPQPLSPTSPLHTHTHSYTLLPALLLPAAAEVVEQEGNREGGVQGLSYQRLTGWAVTQSLPQLVLRSGHSLPHPPASLPPLAGSPLPRSPSTLIPPELEKKRSGVFVTLRPAQGRRERDQDGDRDGLEESFPRCALAAATTRCVSLRVCGARRGRSNSPHPRRVDGAQGVSTA